MKRKTIFLLIAVIAISCTGIKKVETAEINQIFDKDPETWTGNECSKIIQSFTKNNINISENYTADEVIIYATPLNPKVIYAMVRQQAIQRRFTHEMYVARLKEYLEKYTRFTVSEGNENIIPNPNLSLERQNEISFSFKFDNNTDLYRIIEIHKAEEGFFIENKNKLFGRVVFVDSFSMDEYFYLVDEITAVITFSTIDDLGERLFADIESDYFVLSINGLDDDEIRLEWNKTQN